MHLEEFKILQVTRMIEEEPLWFACCSRLFDVANKYGLEGKKISDLRFIPAKPLTMSAFFTAKLEMTDEEYEARQKAFNELLAIYADGLNKSKKP